MSEQTASDEFWVIGHRGSPTLEVENTMPSFRRAVELERANGLEIDLCVTRDGEVVIWHDCDPSGLQSRLRRWGLEPEVAYRPFAPSDDALLKPVHQLALAELREHYGYAEKRLGGDRVESEIPTLDTFMEWAARRPELAVVFLDVKLTDAHTEHLPTLLRRLDRLVDELRPRFRIVLETAHAAIVGELQRLAAAFDCALDVEPHAGVVSDPRECSAVRAAIQHGLRFAMPQKPRSITIWPFQTHRSIVEHDLAELRRHNLEHASTPVDGICAFTINDREEMAELMRLGVVGIQSDRPALLREVAARVRAPSATKN